VQFIHHGKGQRRRQAIPAQATHLVPDNAEAASAKRLFPLLREEASR
jgi:hypothetical protein